jgi:hypothetical protein
VRWQNPLIHLAQIFPKIFAWQMRGILSLQKTILEKAKHSPVPASVVELMAVLERLGAYCMSGNPKVLNRDLLEFSWITKSISSVGAPCFNTKIFPLKGDSLVKVQNYPRNDRGLPAEAAQAAIKYWFGAEVAEVSRVIISYMHARLATSPAAHTAWEHVRGWPHPQPRIWCESICAVGHIPSRALIISHMVSFY